MYEKEITEMLKATGRDGMDKLIEELLVKGGFFDAPASTKYHGCYAGGLAKHSFRVCEMLLEHVGSMGLYRPDTSAGKKPLPLMEETVVVAALLHDVCKIGAYLGTEKPYRWNKKQPKGHALLSVARIEKYIELTDLEKLMITYHMGVYGLNEFYEEGDWQSGEYPLRGDHSHDEETTKEESQAARYGKSLANAWYHNPICKVIYFVDEIETLQAKREEQDEAIVEPGRQSA